MAYFCSVGDEYLRVYKLAVAYIPTINTTPEDSEKPAFDRRRLAYRSEPPAYNGHVAFQYTNSSMSTHISINRMCFIDICIRQHSILIGKFTYKITGVAT